MKTNNYFTLAVLAMFSAACALEEVNVETAVENADVKVTYLNAVGGEEEDVKSTVSDKANFAWANGDQIAVFAGDGYKISDPLAEATGGNNVVFSFSGEESFELDTRANLALFPASLVYDSFGDRLTDGFSPSELLVNLPKQYDLSAVNGNNSPTPMVADNTGKDLKFKSLCALLRFTLVNVPKQTEYITFDFNGKKVCGEYLLNDVVPGETAIQAVATEEMDDIITVCNNGVFETFQTKLVVNVPVPTGEYTDVTITTWEGDPWDGGFKINGITMSINKTVNADGTGYEKWTAGRLTSRKRTIYLPVFTIDGNISLNNGKKAVFAPGNLTATIVKNPTGTAIVGTGTDWSFAENQYDAVNNTIAETERSSATAKENPNLFLKGSEGKKMDLFAWIGATATKEDYAIDEKYGIIWPRLNDSGNTNVSYWLGTGTDKIGTDWGTLAISGGKDIAGYPCPPYPAGTWRLPDYNNPSDSKNSTEWQRVLTARKYLTSDYKNNQVIDYSYAKVTLKDGENVITYGLVIFPDHYDQNEPGTVPAGMPTIQKSNNVGSSVYSDNVITLADWAKLESQGCVFLPAAAYRYKGTPYLTDKIGDGVYWTDYSSGSNNAICMIFSDTSVTSSYLGSTSVNTAKSVPRLNGASVRLLREVN